MFRALKYLAGVWSGAMIVSFGAASALLYLMTGQLLVPKRGGARMLPILDVATDLRALSDKVRVRHHD